MDLFILNQEFETVAIVDNYESLLWTERYCDAGDFEIYTSPDSDILQYAVKDYYLWKRDSDYTMIIEGLQIDSDTEQGNHLTITGRSLESILDRRIVWAQTDISGYFQNIVKRLINDAIINPSIADRKISNFVFEESEDDYITALQIDCQFTGDNLLEAIKSLCEPYDIGFKIALNDNHQFVFSLYHGKDRSYAQTENPYVVFSPKFENIVNSNYLESNSTLKNVALVAGEGEGTARRTRVVGNGVGLSRRELFVDARDIQSETDGRTLSTAEYNSRLDTRGAEKLAENTATQSFEGQVETSVLFKYGEDFFMGDIVQITNEYGMEGCARVMEFVISQSKNGLETYPTFKAIQEEDSE